MTSVINAAHANGTRVVLTVQSFAWTSSRRRPPEGAARQRRPRAPTSPARSPRPSAIAAPTASTSTSSRSSSGYADEFTALVRNDPRRARTRSHTGYQLTFDTTGWIGNYPIEDGDRAGRRRRGRGHGLRLPRRRLVEPVGSIAPDRRPDLRRRATRSRAYLARIPASKVILGVPYYGRAWSTRHVGAPRQEHLGHEVRRVGDRRRTTTAREFAADHGRRYDPVEGVAWTAYRRENCTVDLRLRQRPGASSTTTTPRRSGPSTTWSTATACAAPGSGRSATTARGPSCTRCSRTSSSPTRSRRASPRPSLSAAVVSPNGDGRLDTTTVAGHRHRPRSVGLRASSRSSTASPAPAIRSGSVDRQDRRRSPGTARDDAAARSSPTARTGSRSGPPTPRTTAPRSSRGRDRRPHGRPAIALGRDAGDVSPDGDGRADTPRSSMRAERGAHRDGPRSSTRRGATVRRWTFTRRRRPADWTWNGRDARRRRRARRPVHVPGRRPRPGRQPRRSATRRSCVDRTIRSRALVARRRSIRAAGQTSQVDRHAPPRGDGHGRRSTRVDARPTVWTDRPLAAGTYRWTWNGKTAAGACVKPGTYRVVVTRRAGSARRADPERRRSRRRRPRAPPLHLAAMTDPARPRRPVRRARRAGVWVVLPTYNEAENIGPIAAAILDGAARRRRCSSSTTARPTAPAGWPTSSPRPTRAIRVRHRPAKQGLGPRLPRRLRRRPRRRRRRASSRWTPTSATTRRPARRSSRRSTRRPADLVIGSRYTAGGGVVDWGLGRRIISRGGSLFARIVLGLRPERPDRRLQGVAGRDPGRGPVRRRPRRRLRVPDRDDVPGRAGPARGSARSRSPSATGASASARWRGGSSSRRSSSSSSCGPRSCRGAARGVARTDRDRTRRARPARAAGSDRAARPASGSSSTPGRSRSPTARRSRRPTSTACSARSTPSPLDGRVVRVPARVRPRRPDRAVSTASTSSAAGCCRRPGCCAPAAMTVDPFLLRGASLGAAWRAERGGAAGAVYHAVGGGPLPIASGLPVVVTLLDLAPWELPEAFQRRSARPVRAAAAGPAPARGGRGHRRQRGDGASRPAAAAHPARPAAGRAARAAAGVRRPSAPTRPRGRRRGRERERLGPARALPRLLRAASTPARTSATLLRALAALAAAGRPDGLARGRAWPPRVLLVGASPDDRAALARAAARQGVGERLAYAPGARRSRTWPALVRGARGRVLPVVSEAAGLPAIEAIACGTPVVASAVGAAARARRRGRAARRAAATRTAGRRAARRSGPTTASTTRIAAMRPRAGRRPTAGRGPTSPRETRAVYAEVGDPARTAERTRLATPSAGAASPTGDGAWPAACVRAVLERRPGSRVGMTWMNVWPTVSVTCVAGLVVEPGRLGQRGLLPGALDRLAVGRDPGLARCRRRRPRGGACSDGRR